jgi:arylsulfatase A-like enzyme
MPHAARWWKDAGYQLALLGKNHCFEAQADRDLFDVWCEIEHRGFSDPTSPRGMAWVESEFDVNAAHAVRKNMPPLQGGATSHAITEFEHRYYSTGLLANQADAYLRDRRAQPFVLWLSVPDPHVPYETPKYYFERADAQQIEMPPPGPVPGNDLPLRNRLLSKMMRWPDEHVANLRRVVTAYHANVLHIDDMINRLLDTLQETNQLENTIVVFCSDHGDFAGEHQMMAKGGVFYDCMVRIPMIVSAPEQLPQNEVITSPVSLLDIVPTLFQLQGLSLADDLDGQPLTPCPGAAQQPFAFSVYGAGGPAFSEAQFASLPYQYAHPALFKSKRYRESEGERSMIRNAQWKLVHDPMGDLDELYQLQDDPYEHANLASQPAFATIKAQLMAALYQWRQWD